MGKPFWQQFVYEHLEGICAKCGSIHLTGLCSPASSSGNSEGDCSFGPWMAALRQRIPVQGMEEERRRKSRAGTAPSTAPRMQTRGPTVPPSQSKVPEEGWQLPSKTARRRPPPPTAVVVVADQMQKTSVLGPEGESVACGEGRKGVPESSLHSSVYSSDLKQPANSDGGKAMLKVCRGEGRVPEVSPLSRKKAAQLSVLGGREPGQQSLDAEKVAMEISCIGSATYLQSLGGAAEQITCGMEVVCQERDALQATVDSPEQQILDVDSVGKEISSNRAASFLLNQGEGCAKVASGKEVACQWSSVPERESLACSMPLRSVPERETVVCSGPLDSENEPEGSNSVQFIAASSSRSKSKPTKTILRKGRLNPLAVRGSNRGSGRPQPSSEANPGSTKRARSEDNALFSSLSIPEWGRREEPKPALDGNDSKHLEEVVSVLEQSIRGGADSVISMPEGDMADGGDVGMEIGPRTGEGSSDVMMGGVKGGGPTPSSDQ